MSTAVAHSVYQAPRILSFALRRWLTIGSILLSDCIATMVAVALAFVLVSLMGFGFSSRFGYVPFLTTTLVFLAVFALIGLYPGVPNNPIVEFRKILHAFSISLIILISACFVMRDDVSNSSWLTLALIWIHTFIAVPLGRLLTRGCCSRFWWWGIPTVILGARDTGQELLQTLRDEPRLGLRPVAIQGESGIEDSIVLAPSGKSTIEPMSYLTALAEQRSSCYAIVAMPHLNSDELCEVLMRQVDKYNRVLIVPDLFGMSSLVIAPRDINGVLGLEIDQGLTQFLPQAVKRCCDLVISFAASILFAPAILIVYLAVRLTSPGPAFYGQRRIGRNNKEFTAWKFRSMVINAGEVLQQYLDDNPSLREEWDKDHKLKKDPRITTVGRIIRKTSLDELPQLWNVLRGQMSLVGPRPIVSAEVHKYGKRYNHYQRVKPGITGLWQTNGRNNTTYEMRTKLDEYYVRNWSVSLDLYILIRTIKTVLFTEGAY
jgi:Undecaprenyl-phosphate galactose phosphotransferase WbaP